MEPGHCGFQTRPLRSETGQRQGGMRTFREMRNERPQALLWNSTCGRRRDVPHDRHGGLRSNTWARQRAPAGLSSWAINNRRTFARTLQTDEYPGFCNPSRGWTTVIAAGTTYSRARRHIRCGETVWPHTLARSPQKRDQQKCCSPIPSKTRMAPSMTNQAPPGGNGTPGRCLVI